MPTYDYRCEANNRVIEVKHGMNESLSTWGDLCEKAGVEPGNTPLDTAVVRLVSGGHLVTSSSGLSDAPAPCASGACGGGFCGLN